MASADITTSSNHLSSAASDEAAKRSVDTSFLKKMKSLVEKLRLENATLKKSLDIERSGVRALKAQHEATLRQLRNESRKREEALEKQLRSQPISEKQAEPPPASVGVKKLCSEIQSLKAANKSLQEKLKVAIETERERAGELRAQETQHASHDLALQKDARAQVHKLLEEIKSKDRTITQLKKATSTQCPHDSKQVQRMESGSTELRKLRLDQGKEQSDREDLKTDIRHRKETFYREVSDGDSAVSSAPTSLSPQPLADMWACGQCRAAGERAESSARECARLTDALRDARDQLELLEFRLLELEDAAPDKGARENLTDSDSGCVSPGSRLKDSASPELRRMDSGYKSPHTPASPAPARRALSTPPAHPTAHDDGRGLLADILDRSLYSESSDSLKSNPVKEHLEQMMLSAGSAEDRACLEQVLMLLYSLQTLSSSSAAVSDDDAYQIKSKRLCDIKSLSKLDADLSSLKCQKVIATVSPYSRTHRAFGSVDSLCEDPKKTSVLQESGIFDDVETENKTTQTEGYDSLECGDLNTEIQRLNSIREKLEKRGVARSRPLGRLHSEEEGLECRCVKLGQRHKQYYERRLKFLEGKISIYEAAQDVKKAKLAQRLQNEFILENRIQDLESQLSTLQDKYEQLEEDCCELEEIENDTRLHCQQLETDYELTRAQLRDMSEQRECSRAQAERLTRALSDREAALTARAAELSKRLTMLEQAMPALIAWNVVCALGGKDGQCGKKPPNPTQKKTVPGIALCTCGGTVEKPCRCGSGGVDKHKKTSTTHASCAVKEAAVPKAKNKSPCLAVVAWKHISQSSPDTHNQMQKLAQLTKEKASLEAKAEKQKLALEKQIQDLKRQLSEEGVKMRKQQETVEAKIKELERQLSHNIEPVDAATGQRLHCLIKSEQELSARVHELERRETAYLEMLTQADDMWAEMEGGYKQRITEADHKMSQLETERDKLRNKCVPLKKQIRELEQSESAMRVSLEKAERDFKQESARGRALDQKLAAMHVDLTTSQTAFLQLSKKYKKEIDDFRRQTAKLAEQLRCEMKGGREAELKLGAEIDKAKKELARSCKNVMDLEVTNSELREEVESLESQLALMQKTIAQCKRKCEEKIKVISHELSIKTEELEELRSEVMRRSLRPSVREEMRADRTEYCDDGGYTLCTAVPQKPSDYGRMHRSLDFIASDARCSCPAMRSQLVGSLIEDLFERMHDAADDDLAGLCAELAPGSTLGADDTKAKITNYLLMAISKELVRSIGDADAKTDTEEWQRAVSSTTYSLPTRDALSAAAAGNAGVLSGAARLASVSCACAAARLCAALPDLADTVKNCQEEVLEHSDVQIMEEQLANAIENIVNCPSCALGTNAIVWSTDV